MTESAPPPPTPPGFWPTLATYLPSRIAWKSLGIAAIGLSLLIPLFMIEAVVDERQGRFLEAVRSIGGSWGPAQRLAGPVVTLTYAIPSERLDARDGVRLETAALLPERLQIDARLRVEPRSRGLFTVNIYRAEVTMTGEFALADLASRIGRSGRPDWSTLAVRLGIADLRSVQMDGDAVLGDRKLGFDAAGDDPLLGNAIAAPVAPPLDPAAEARVPFRVRFTLQGSHQFAFAALGRANEIGLAANWDSPSFAGAHLPTQWSYQGDGFVAAWQIGHLGRGMSQVLLGPEIGVAGKALGETFARVELVTPVSPYRLTERAIKYGMLFVTLTFAVFLLVERLTGQALHVAQYVLLGFAQCLFFLLLVALAEHIGFALAYLVSAAAIVAQTGLYVRAAIGRGLPVAIYAAMIAALYAYLYVLLQLEDRSLAAGAIFLFVVLSALMYATRGLARGDRGAPAPP